MNVRIVGDGIPILFLHGIPTNNHLWDMIVPQMKGFKCILVDLPGMGKSKPLDNNTLIPNEYAQAMEDLRVELFIDSWHIVGHDAGATIALHYVNKYSKVTKSLTLCSPPIFPELNIPSFFKLLRIKGFGEFIAPVIKFIVFKIGLPMMIKPKNDITNNIVKRFQESYQGQKGTKKLLFVLRWGNPNEVLKETASLMPDITVPTLIMQGKNDKTIPMSFATRAKKIIKNAELQIINGAHFFPINCYNESSTQLTTFLEKH